LGEDVFFENALLLSYCASVFYILCANMGETEKTSLPTTIKVLQHLKDIQNKWRKER
jgi:hypothetical protein